MTNSDTLVIPRAQDKKNTRKQRHFGNFDGEGWVEKWMILQGLYRDSLRFQGAELAKRCGILQDLLGFVYGCLIFNDFQLFQNGELRLSVIFQYFLEHFWNLKKSTKSGSLDPLFITDILLKIQEIKNIISKKNISTCWKSRKQTFAKSRTSKC